MHASVGQQADGLERLSVLQGDNGRGGEEGYRSVRPSHCETTEKGTESSGRSSIDRQHPYGQRIHRLADSKQSSMEQELPARATRVHRPERTTKERKAKRKKKKIAARPYLHPEVAHHHDHGVVVQVQEGQVLLPQHQDNSVQQLVKLGEVVDVGPEEDGAGGGGAGGEAHDPRKRALTEAEGDGEREANTRVSATE